MIVDIVQMLLRINYRFVNLKYIGKGTHLCH